MLTRRKLRIYIITLLCILYSADGTFRHARYYKAKRYISLTQESLYSVKAEDPIDCSTRCLIRKCSCFSFDKQFQQCNTGNCVVNNSATDMSKEYYLLCDLKDGFKPLSYGSITACVWESTTTLIYKAARDDCKAKGANLYTIKSLGKLRILQKNYYKDMWVGLNDLNVEGTYRWEDDGSVCDPDCRQQIFGTGEPNDMNGNEDCMNYSLYHNGTLNDNHCSISLLYICEKP